MKVTCTDDVLDLLDAHFTSTALGAALEMGLFRLLAERPLHPAGVAQALGIPVGRCNFWLQILSRAGLIEETAAGYQPSAIALSAILGAYTAETWALLAEEARERLPGLRDLPLRIRQAGSTWAASGPTPKDYVARMADDPERARRFTRMLREIHTPLAEEIERSLDLAGVSRLMDLGGGSGVVSLSLARRRPGLTAVVVDVASVCAAGREIAAEESLEERVRYHPADFLRDDLPGGFDMVLECDVNVFSQDLFRKVHAALLPGGRFVIVDQLSPAPGIAPASWLHWAFERSLIDPGFTGPPTAAEVRALLQAAGFRVLSETTLSPIPGVAARDTRDMTLIDATR